MVPHMQQRFEVVFRHPNDDGFVCFSCKPKNEFVLTTLSRGFKSLKPFPDNKHHFLIYLRRGRFFSAKVRCFIEYLTNEFKLNPWVSDDEVRQAA